MNGRILLVDDEDLIIRSMNKALSANQYDVVICRSGVEALEKIKLEDVDLVICDIRMPRMNGIETIRKMREYLEFAGREPVREILMTGYAEENLDKRAEELKVAEYIYKPFEIREFISCVEKNIR